MKRILHIRFPINATPIVIEKTIQNTKDECKESFYIVASLDVVDETEFEIVYDPCIKEGQAEQLLRKDQNEPSVNTSFQEGSLAR